MVIYYIFTGEIMIEHVDVLIVGAGPAGLFLAKELLGISNQTVALVDSGRSIKRDIALWLIKGIVHNVIFVMLLRGLVVLECIQMENYHLFQQVVV